jgi:hypothetical protein
MENDDLELLEEIIRREGLKETVLAVSNICSDIADECRSNDNEELADQWEDASEDLDELELGDL